MPCRTKTLAKSPATSVTYCEDCKCYHLSIGPVTCRLDEANVAASYRNLVLAITTAKKRASTATRRSGSPLTTDITRVKWCTYGCSLRFTGSSLQ